MNLTDAYAQIWRGKLEGIAPPDQQHIDRVTWTAGLFGEATGPLLDVGCGSGAMLAEAKRRGWDCLGFDADANVVEWLVSLGYDCRVQSADSGRWLLAPGSYSIVTACDVIEHLIDPAHMLAEAFRVLRSGGRILVSTPNCANWRRWAQLVSGQMFRTSGDNVLKDGGHLGYWTPADLTDALQATGFGNVTPHLFSPDEIPHPVAAAMRTMGIEPRPWHAMTYVIAEAVKP